MTAAKVDADSARRSLINRRNELVGSGQWFPFREEVQCLAEPSFEAVLANMTDAEILDIPDEDAIFIHGYDDDLEGVRLNGTFLLGIIGNLDDWFLSPEPEIVDPHTESGLPTSKKGKGGRPPANWWPDAFAVFGHMMIDEDYDVSNEAMLNRVLDRLAEEGIIASRSTLQLGISKFYARLRKRRE